MGVSELSAKLKGSISKAIVGKDEVIDRVIITMLCGGHLLLEDLPGTGKTTLAKSVAKSVDCSFKRIQFTPDLLPSDLTGINFFNRKTDSFEFKEGSIFTNILLADEINRATPRTQSSLLECMEERQATIDGNTYKMKDPFMVIATQNPIEIQGTFPLPEAQLDRFFMQLSMGYPSVENELVILGTFILDTPVENLEAVASAEEIISAREEVKKVKVSDAVRGYILDIVTATRTSSKVRMGVSPRGSLALLRAAQGYAAINGRDYVLPDDVKAVAKDVLCHRIIVKGYSSERTAAAVSLVNDILNDVPVPREEA